MCLHCMPLLIPNLARRVSAHLWWRRGPRALPLATKKVVALRSSTFDGVGASMYPGDLFGNGRTWARDRKNSDRAHKGKRQLHNGNSQTSDKRTYSTLTYRTELNESK